jgi:hypothetical protein
MATTHAALGALLALPVAAAGPEVAAPAALGGFVGGLFPDLDVVWPLDHRKSLHFPEYAWLVALPAAGYALLRPGPLSVGVALFALAAAVHAVSDVLGGGLGMRPWLADDDRGVYSQFRGRWYAPRRYVRYDGAPEDLLAVCLLSLPGLLVFGPPVRHLLIAGLVVSVAYATIRRRLPDWALSLSRFVRTRRGERPRP